MQTRTYFRKVATFSQGLLFILQPARENPRGDTCPNYLAG